MIEISKLANINEQIKKILPTSFEFHICSETPAHFRLYAQEQALTHNMSTRRFEDFSAGRYCIKSALKKLGINNYPVLIGNSRQPILPNNVSASISHTNKLIAAVAVKSHTISSIGIDLEQPIPLEQELLTLVCHQQEIKYLRTQNNPLLCAKIIFSIKESIYKCLNPLANIWIDFHDVEILSLHENGDFAAKLKNQRLAKFSNHLLKGRYLLTKQLLFSYCQYSDFKD